MCATELGINYILCMGFAHTSVNILSKFSTETRLQYLSGLSRFSKNSVGHGN